jgi:hypothetical protein
VPLDLEQHCELADEILALVRVRLPGTQPQVRDWNDRLLVEGFGRAYRCLRSIRELAGRKEGEDVAVLTRALIALTLRYLWLARAEGEDERADRLRRLLKKWASERATLGEEMIDLDHVVEEGGDQFRATVAQFREQADEFEREGVGRVPGDRAIAMRLDADLQPEVPRYFELLYTRIYRTTSDAAHYGIATALAGYPRNPDDPGQLSLERADEHQAAEALGLAIVTYGTLLSFSEPVVRHGLAEEVGEKIQARRLGG